MERPSCPCLPRGAPMLRGLFVIESRRAWVGSLPAAQGQPGSCGGPGAGVGHRPGCAGPATIRRAGPGSLAVGRMTHGRAAGPVAPGDRAHACGRGRGRPQCRLPARWGQRCSWECGGHASRRSCLGGPGTSQASLEQRGVGAEGGRFRGVRSGRFLDGHFFLCSFTQSLHMEPLLRVVVQGIWDPGEKMGSAPVPVESLASLAPQGHLFIYPQGPQI